MIIVEANHEADDEGDWGLEWTVVGESGSGGDEQVEEDTERCKTDYDPGDDTFDSEEVVGEGITEKEESGLEHERQTFHDEVEVPCDHSIHLTLPMAATIDDRPAHLCLRVTVEPLLAQHGNERGEERSGQTRIEDSLDVYYGGVGTRPLRESRIEVGWGMAQ